MDIVSNKLDQSQALQNRFDLWAGNWFGGKKRAAIREAQQEIAARNNDEAAKVKEVFEHEKFESMTRTWKPAGLALCTNPTQAAPDVFDPKEQAKVQGETNWIIDYSLSGIDAEGWTYAYDFDSLNKKGVGDCSPQWNSYVRRRKWRHHDKRGGGNQVINDIKERNAARIGSKPTSQAEKVGYVPRSRQAGMTASGLTSAGMIKGKKQDDLDEDSANGLAQLKANDNEIDAGLDAISSVLDNLGGISSTMKSEIHTQNAKLDRLDQGMQRAADKQAVVNARQKKLLQSS